MKRRAAFLLLIALFLAIVPLVHHHEAETSEKSREHEATCVLSILAKSATSEVAVPVVEGTSSDPAASPVDSITILASADVLAISSPRGPPSYSI
jgi:hypothetical protein